MGDSEDTRQPRNRALFSVLVVATIIDILAAYLLRRTTPVGRARLALVLLPVPANLILIAMIVKTIRGLDEFLRFIHLEAVAIGFLLTGLAVFIYGYLQAGHLVRPLNVGLVWFFMALFYGVGYAIASRHYR